MPFRHARHCLGDCVTGAELLCLVPPLEVRGRERCLYFVAAVAVDDVDTRGVHAACTIDDMREHRAPAERL